MMPKEKRKKKKKYILNKKRMTAIIMILILFLAIIAFAISIEFGFIEFSLKDINIKPKLFVLKDECSLIVGNLIHTIKNSGGCELKCKTNCDIRDMNFHNSEFIKKEDDCNECKCYCTSF